MEKLKSRCKNAMCHCHQDPIEVETDMRSLAERLTMENLELRNRVELLEALVERDRRLDA
jgi:hypothetical protein